MFACFATECALISVNNNNYYTRALDSAAAVDCAFTVAFRTGYPARISIVVFSERCLVRKLDIAR